ncbi:hypothetical protein [Collinsella tanakaei]|uniref:hypothetical protein n=1 Tax=Collinsella tanakaei TaxID=626935 RepID=UPI001F262F92|nr:hypothetical protein [Collinsella tanakaei]MCF2620794.1 hypothetical protein [Collinsella tanakaei]
MHIPYQRIADALKMGVSTLRDADEPVRVAVFVDATATPALVDCVKEGFVPQTTSALVRVARLSDDVEVKSDTDVAIVVTCGSEQLQEAVQRIIVTGTPTVVLCESSVEAPFITKDTPMLGLISSTDKTYLLETLARWILERTEKQTAFASNFPFMRIAAANRIITSCAMANMATGALVFIPGADYPVMALAQIGMLLDLAAVFGKPLRMERGYEIAAVLAGGLALRAAARAATQAAPRLGFAVKALVAAGGTFGMGRALMFAYERDIDYSRANDMVLSVADRCRRVASGFMGRADIVVDDVQAV